MKKVALFVTCLVDMFKPEAAQAAVAVLERRGCAVSCPDGQTCCGQFSFNAGYREEAALLARHWIETFEATDEPIVALSGSCAAMVSHSYPQLLYDVTLDEGGSVQTAASWKARAEAVGQRIYELSQWLAQEDGGDQASTKPGESTSLVYHLGCHMRRLLHAHLEAEHVMQNVGVDLQEPEDAEECCGFGGTYSMTEPTVSTALADAKWQHIREKERACDAVGLVGTDMGCLLHLQGRAERQHASRPVFYLAEVLDLVDRGRWPARERGTRQDDG